MTIINLKVFFYWYTKDEFIVISDEVAAELRSNKRYEPTHQRRLKRNNAQYSLYVGGGIENDACKFKPSPEKRVIRTETLTTGGKDGIPCIYHLLDVGKIGYFE